MIELCGLNTLTDVSYIPPSTRNDNTVPESVWDPEELLDDITKDDPHSLIKECHKNKGTFCLS